MLSLTVQNKILMAAENVGLQMIKDELGDGKYAILSYATRNGAHKEVEAVVLRYLHNKCLYERTVGMVDISKDQTAQGIAIAIQEIMSPIELNPSQCRAVDKGGLGGLKPPQFFYHQLGFLQDNPSLVGLSPPKKNAMCWFFFRWSISNVGS